MAVVQLAKKHQIGTERAHPISLIDMWSPSTLLPTENEMQLRREQSSRRLSFVVTSARSMQQCSSVGR